MRVFFTEHALDRFLERKMPGCTRSQARQEMGRLFEESVPLRDKTQMGDTQRLSGEVVFVLKHDGKDGTDCITILFDRRNDTNMLAQEIEQWGVAPLEPASAPAKRRAKSRRTNRWKR